MNITIILIILLFLWSLSALCEVQFSHKLEIFVPKQTFVWEIVHGLQKEKKKKFYCIAFIGRGTQTSQTRSSNSSKNNDNNVPCP